MFWVSLTPFPGMFVMLGFSACLIQLLALQSALCSTLVNTKRYDGTSAGIIK